MAYGYITTDPSIFSLRMLKRNKRQVVVVYLPEGATYYSQDHPLDTDLIASLEAGETNRRDHFNIEESACPVK